MSLQSELSEEVRRLLQDQIVSFEQLEALLFLRCHRDEEFALRSIADALRLSAPATEEALDHLAGEHFLNVRVNDDNRIFKYSPENARMEHAVEQLADLWSNSRLTVANLMSANAIARVRTKALRTFADAFLLGRKKTDE